MICHTNPCKFITLQPEFEFHSCLDKGATFQLGHDLSHGRAVPLVPMHTLCREVVDNLGTIQAPPRLAVHDVRDREVCLVSLVVDVRHLEEDFTSLTFFNYRHYSRKAVIKIHSSLWSFMSTVYTRV